MHTSYKILAVWAVAHLAQAKSDCKSTWTELAPIPIIPRQENSAVAINSTTFAVLGGIKAVTAEIPWANTALVTYYDIPSDTWIEGPDMPIGLNHPNTAVVDGKIYLLGGLLADTAPWDATPDSWVLDPAVGRWESIAPFPEGTERGAAVVGVHGSRIFLAGGLRSLDPRRGGPHVAVDELSAYDTATGEWTAYPGSSLPVPKDHAAGAVIGSTLWVTGGRHIAGGNTRTHDVFALDLDDVEAGWEDLTEEAGIPTARSGHMAGAIGHLLYTFGGEGNPDPDSRGVFSETEVFDTKTRKWKSLQPMLLPRHGTGGVAVGKAVYIPGGGLIQGPLPTNTTEVFRP